MPSVRASCCPLPLATPSGECVNHQSSVTLLCLDYKWGLLGIIKQICHASGGNMMECFPSGGWFSLGLRPRENHPPSGKHSIMLPPLAWHICIIYIYIYIYTLDTYIIIIPPCFVTVMMLLFLSLLNWPIGPGRTCCRMTSTGTRPARDKGSRTSSFIPANTHIVI